MQRIISEAIDLFTVSLRADDARAPLLNICGGVQVEVLVVAVSTVRSAEQLGRAASGWVEAGAWARGPRGS
jgi:hypothetical protein